MNQCVNRYYDLIVSAREPVVMHAIPWSAPVAQILSQFQYISFSPASRRGHHDALIRCGA